jgi:exosome complex RNA-binding protein Rrp42 (RNase PH superfamily)
MEEQVFQILQPEKHLRQFLEYQLRPDGRQFYETRPLHISRNILKKSCLGSSAISAHHSKYITGVTATITGSDTPNVTNGHVSVTFEFPKTSAITLSSTQRKPGLAADLGVKLTQIITSPSVLDPSVFVIAPQSCSWLLYVNIVCLEYDGNPLDHSLLSVIAALEDTVLPAIQWNSAAKWWQIAPPVTSSSLQPNLSPSHHYIPSRRIIFKNKPQCVTLSLLLDKYWVVDATALEEANSTNLTLCQFDKKDVSTLTFLKDGGPSINLFSILPYVLPLFHHVRTTIEKHIADTKKNPITQSIWQPCFFDAPSSFENNGSSTTPDSIDPTLCHFPESMLQILHTPPPL